MHKQSQPIQPHGQIVNTYPTPEGLRPAAQTSALLAGDPSEYGYRRSEGQPSTGVVPPYDPATNFFDVVRPVSQLLVYPPSLVNGIGRIAKDNKDWLHKGTQDRFYTGYQSTPGALGSGALYSTGYRDYGAEPPANQWFEHANDGVAVPIRPLPAQRDVGRR